MSHLRYRRRSRRTDLRFHSTRWNVIIHSAANCVIVEESYHYHTPTSESFTSRDLGFFMKGRYFLFVKIRFSCLKKTHVLYKCRVAAYLAAIWINILYIYWVISRSRCITGQNKHRTKLNRKKNFLISFKKLKRYLKRVKIGTRFISFVNGVI